jgi:hypothetical protein
MTPLFWSAILVCLVLTIAGLITVFVLRAKGDRAREPVTRGIAIATAVVALIGLVTLVFVFVDT